MPNEPTTALSAERFSRMLANGCRRLRANSAAVDALNVFPVPDGDTGRNMTMTLCGGVNATQPGGDGVGGYLKRLSRNTLLAARGNSGVILSQFVRGLAMGAADAVELTPTAFARAFGSGAEQARRAVTRPVEGTILTLLRDGADFLAAHAFDDFEACFTGLLDCLRASLERTPALLPALREAGVVDSGGAGLVLIIEGMAMALSGRWVEEDAEAEAPAFIALPASRAQSASRRRYGVVAVAPGAGIARLMLDNGADAVVEGGPTRNPSGQELLDALERVDAEHVVMLPDDPNVILTARQAASLYRGDARVLETRSVAEGYAALSIMNPDVDEVDALLAEMRAAVAGVVTGLVSRASRDSALQGLSIRKGDWLGLVGNRILAVADSPEDAALRLLESVEDIGEKSVVTGFYDGEAGESERGAIQRGVNARWPEMEIGFVYGGQDVYRYIFAIE